MSPYHRRYCSDTVNGERCTQLHPYYAHQVSILRMEKATKIKISLNLYASSIFHFK